MNEHVADKSVEYLIRVLMFKIGELYWLLSSLFMLSLSPFSALCPPFLLVLPVSLIHSPLFLSFLSLVYPDFSFFSSQFLFPLSLFTPIPPLFLPAFLLSLSLTPLFHGPPSFTPQIFPSSSPFLPSPVFLLILSLCLSSPLLLQSLSPLSYHNSFLNLPSLRCFPFLSPPFPSLPSYPNSFFIPPSLLSFLSLSSPSPHDSSIFILLPLFFVSSPFTPFLHSLSSLPVDIPPPLIFPHFSSLTPLLSPSTLPLSLLPDTSINTQKGINKELERRYFWRCNL